MKQSRKDTCVMLLGSMVASTLLIVPFIHNTKTPVETHSYLDSISDEVIMYDSLEDMEINVEESVTTEDSSEVEAIQQVLKNNTIGSIIEAEEVEVETQAGRKYRIEKELRKEKAKILNAKVAKDFATGGKYADIELHYTKAYNVTKQSNRLTTGKGVVEFEGHRETYYSQKVLPGHGLKIPGRHVAEDGTIRDEDGYICVAADPEFMKRHSILMTSLGPAKVYDCGCAYGTIDIYVNW